MRRYYIIAGIVLACFIVLQFFQPEKNQAGERSGGDLMAVLEVPDSISAFLLNACYDCHSNHTQYPWYSKISPVSWFLNAHIVKGKEELNFEEIGQLENRKQVGALSEICEVLEAGTMPLKSYILIHRDARLTREESEAICNWADEEALKLMKK